MRGISSRAADPSYHRPAIFLLGDAVEVGPRRHPTGAETPNGLPEEGMQDHVGLGGHVGEGCEGVRNQHAFDRTGGECVPSLGALGAEGSCGGNFGTARRESRGLRFRLDFVAPGMTVEMRDLIWL